VTAGIRWKVDRRHATSAIIGMAASAAVGDAAEVALEEANRTAPIEEGVLIGSGSVDVEPLRHFKARASVFYDTPYAVRQHEDTRLRHDEGRRAKWLERTLAEQGRRLGKIIAAGIKARLP
jgi:hypothetical protein